MCYTGIVKKDGWGDGRGIEQENVKQNETKQPFSGKRLQAAQMLASPDFNGTVTELIRELDVSRATFYRWMGEREYLDFISSLIDRYTDSELASVWKALIRQCKAGDISAIRLYFELKGKYRQQIDLGGSVVFISGEEKLED